jgi:hypothetical protein
MDSPKLRPSVPDLRDLCGEKLVQLLGDGNETKVQNPAAQKSKSSEVSACKISDELSVQFASYLPGEQEIFFKYMKAEMARLMKVEDKHEELLREMPITDRSMWEGPLRLDWENEEEDENEESEQSREQEANMVDQDVEPILPLENPYSIARRLKKDWMYIPSNTRKFSSCSLLFPNIDAVHWLLTSVSSHT